MTKIIFETSSDYAHMRLMNIFQKKERKKKRREKYVPYASS
jgi:hypothetical protein